MKPITKYILLAGAVLSVPATLYSFVDTYFQISQYGSIGTNTMTSAYQSLAVGQNNVFGASGGSNVSYCAAIGYALQVHSSSSLVVGNYNTPNSVAFFIVGNGSSALRKNAFEVLNSGTVNIPGTANIGKVPERGGISMGAFTLP